MIELQPGPLELIDIDAVMGTAPTPDLEGFVAGRVGDVVGADDRLASNLSIMATDLDGLGPDDPGSDLDEATGAHTIEALAPDPDFSGELGAAEVGSAQLAGLAGTLPADPDAENDLTVDLGDDEFEGVDWPGTIVAPGPPAPKKPGDEDPGDDRPKDRDDPEPPTPPTPPKDPDDRTRPPRDEPPVIVVPPDDGDVPVV